VVRCSILEIETCRTAALPKTLSIEHPNNVSGDIFKQSRDVDADLPNDQIRLRECEQQPVRLDVPDDLNGFQSAPGEVGNRCDGFR
jgi:hypothetical protein